jgi:hypothetical protein
MRYVARGSARCIMHAHRTMLACSAPDNNTFVPGAVQNIVKLRNKLVIIDDFVLGSNFHTKNISISS